MVRHWRLHLTGLVIAALLLAAAGPAVAAKADACTGAGLFAGCPAVDASADDRAVSLIGTAVTPGGNAGGGPGAQGPNGSERGAPVAKNDVCDIPRGTRCYGTVPKGTTASPIAAVPTPSVTLRDLASFRPAPGTQQMEPDGWVVPGLDANFYALVGQQLVPGTLLGRPATVRFTPTAFHWNYGDGSAVVRSTKGGTWAQLGLADFDPTPTSHVYDAEGEYVIRLTIDFRAEYQFAGGAFRPVVGTIALPANDLRVTVTGAKTVLVEHDCVANPSGPGC